MYAKLASTLVLQLALAQAVFAMPSQEQLEHEMGTLRQVRHESFDTALCHFSQKLRSVLTCPFGKIEKEKAKLALNEAGWKLIESNEVREWFFYTGDSLTFQKGKLKLSMYFFSNESRDNIESLYSY